MNNKKGCAAIRLVHLLDPVGKGFFKGLWDRHVFTNWDFAYGFSRGKRREAAIVHQRSLRHSLKKRGCSVHTGFFDVASAFPSPSHEALDSMLHATCPANDVAFLVCVSQRPMLRRVWLKVIGRENISSQISILHQKYFSIHRRKRYNQENVSNSGHMKNCNQQSVIARPH